MLTLVPARGRWKLVLGAAAIAATAVVAVVVVGSPRATGRSPAAAPPVVAPPVVAPPPVAEAPRAPAPVESIPVAPARPRIETACTAASCQGQDDLDGDGAPDCWRWDGDADGGDAATFAVQRACTGPWLRLARGETPLWSLPDAVARDPRLLDGVLAWIAAAPRAAVDDWLVLRLDMLGRRGPDGPSRAAQEYAPRWQPAAPASTSAQAVVVPPAIAAVLVADDRRAALSGPPDDPGRARRAARTPPPRSPMLYAAGSPGPLTRQAACARFAVWASRRAVAVEEVAGGRWSWVHDAVGAGAGDGEVERVACVGDLVIAELHDDELAIRWQVVIEPDRGRWRILGTELDQWSIDEAAGALVGVDTEGADQRFTIDQLRELLR